MESRQASFDAFKSAEGGGAEILRDNILRRGQAAAILYRNGQEDAELFAIQTATALSIGKPFGGFIPARPLKVCIVGHKRDAAELGQLRDILEDYWKSAGWTDEEVGQALRDTHFLDGKGQTGDAIVKTISETQAETPFDLIVLCNLIGCYGDDPERPSSQSLSRFLQAGLGGIQNGAHPCAVLGLIGCEDREAAISDFLNGTRIVDYLLEDAEARESKLLDSAIGRAVAEWASGIFVFGYARGEDNGSILVLASVRNDGRLLWCCPAYGEGCGGHALRYRGNHFEEAALESFRQKTRKIVEENYSCADTLEAEIEL